MKELTIKEKQVLDYISACFAENGYSPSVRDIQNELGFGSTATVFNYIQRLIDKGWLKKDANKSRSLRPESAAPIYHVPIIGKVTAGAPILAYEEDQGFVSFCSEKKKYQPDRLFALKVRGRSMIGAGIMDGDTVIVERTPAAQNGEIVVALIDDEATVKRFFSERGTFRLQPENPEYKPIYTDHVRILGKVIANIRYY